MVNWAWLVFAFFGGVIFGIFMIALAIANRETNSERKQTKDD